MTDFEVLRWAAIAIGLIYLITESLIASPLRWVFSRLGIYTRVLIYCPACTGFWVGLALGALGYWLPNAPIEQRLFQSSLAATTVGAIWGRTGVNSAWFAEQGTADDLETEKENGE